MADIQFDHVDSILDEFRDLKDLRSHINRRHLLGDLIVICIMAVVAVGNAQRTRSRGRNHVLPNARS